MHQKDEYLNSKISFKMAEDRIYRVILGVLIWLLNMHCWFLSFHMVYLLWI